MRPASTTSPRLFGFLLALLPFAPGCGASYDSPPSEGDAGAPGAGPFDVPHPPAGCTPSRLPADDACTIHEAFGVFVSSGGKDTNMGSRDSPLRTIATGVRIAALTKRRVYLCAQTYVEPIVFRAGVPIFGYFDCTAGWKVVTSRRARVAPRAHHIAARAFDIHEPTRVESIEVYAGDAESGASSIALIAERSPGLAFFRSVLRAGRGGDGHAGVAPLDLVNDGSAAGESGDVLRFGPCDAACLTRRRTRPKGGSNSCGGSTPVALSQGGDGARAGFVRYRTHAEGDPPLCFPILSTGRADLPLCYYPDPGELMETGLPSAESMHTARGANFGYSTVSGEVVVRHTMLATAGEAGKDGKNGDNGVLGTFSSNGYGGGDGVPGEHGRPGQGGGGGSAQVPRELFVQDYVPVPFAFAAMGGGGGAGGCPGRAGSPGTGGGASVAVIAIDSGLSFDEATTLVAATGGLGGEGSFGSAPSEGGAGGAGTSEFPETRGAPGGRGGRAGASGHGAAGPTIGIAWRRVRPTWFASPSLGPAALARPTRTQGRVAIPEGVGGLRAEELSF
ncbi:MAG: hypothetical protein U0174_10140 [Polyangiaceae bacterium]